MLIIYQRISILILMMNLIMFYNFSGIFLSRLVILF